MKKKLILWAVPCIAIAALAGPVYKASRVRPAALQKIEPVHSSRLVQADRDQELQSLQHDLAQNPAHVPILLRLAQLSREGGKLDKSVEYLRQAVSEDPKNHDALLELGRALFETGDVEGGIRETRRLLELDDSNVDALYNLGAIYGNLGQDDQARQYWKKAVELAPSSESGRRATTGLRQLAAPLE
jgi:Flp pilus assembly protein TadD